MLVLYRISIYQENNPYKLRIFYTCLKEFIKGPFSFDNMSIINSLFFSTIILLNTRKYSDFNKVNYKHRYEQTKRIVSDTWSDIFHIFIHKIFTQVI